MVVPAQTSKIDTAGFCNLLELPRICSEKRMKAAENYSQTGTFCISETDFSETYAGSRKRCFCIRDFMSSPEHLENIHKPVAAHVLGYVSEVDEEL